MGGQAGWGRLWQARAGAGWDRLGQDGAGAGRDRLGQAQEAEGRQPDLLTKKIFFHQIIDEGYVGFHWGPSGFIVVVV